MQYLFFLLETTKTNLNKKRKNVAIYYFLYETNVGKIDGSSLVNVTNTIICIKSCKIVKVSSFIFYHFQVSQASKKSTSFLQAFYKHKSNYHSGFYDQRTDKNYKEKTTHPRKFQNFKKLSAPSCIEEKITKIYTSFCLTN